MQTTKHVKFITFPPKWVVMHRRPLVNVGNYPSQAPRCEQLPPPKLLSCEQLSLDFHGLGSNGALHDVHGRSVGRSVGPRSILEDLGGSGGL